MMTSHRQFRAQKRAGLKARPLAAAAAGVWAAVLGQNAARADNAPNLAALVHLSDPSGVVLAIRSEEAPLGGAIRLSVYDSEETFLETASLKVEGAINDDGFAILPLGALAPGEYAFVAYYDENRDGKLNRTFLGTPKESFGFSNGVRPKLGKPDFEDAKVAVSPGAVVLVTIKD